MIIRRKGQRKVLPVFEVFKPKDGKAFYQTRYVRLAKAVAWAFNADYARAGDGWVASIPPPPPPPKKKK